MRRIPRWLGIGLLSLATALIAGCSDDDDDGGGDGGESSVEVPSRAYVGSVGVGVPDLDAAVAFYVDGLGMREIQRLTRADRDEVVLVSADERGSALVLMHYTDGSAPDYLQNPGKLVYYVADPDAIAAAITAAGGVVTAPPAQQGPELGYAVVGFARDPNNNLIEIVGADDALESYLSAFGIGVSDLQAARDFYVDTLGFEETLFLTIPGWYDEFILSAPVAGGSSLVLMHYTDGRAHNYQDNPVKLVMEASAPETLAADIEAAGETVLQQPAADPALGDTEVAYAEDADGTLLEIRQSIKAHLGAAGLGVADLASAVGFYVDGLGLEELERRSRADRDEVVLASADGTGSEIVLFHMTDGSTPDYGQYPGKLVFYAPDAVALAASIQAAGGTVVSPPVDLGPAYGHAVVGFAVDREGNLLELVGVPGTATPYLAAFGIGVSDLDSALAFYRDGLGFALDAFLSVSRGDGTPWYDEYILQAAGGSALVLMHFTDGSARDYQDNAQKLEIRTLSPPAFIAAAVRAGGSDAQDAAYSEEPDMDEAIVGYVDDLDGYLLEVLLTP